MTDTGKDPWHLLPWDAVRGVVKVLAAGAIEYGDRDWEKGLSYSRCYSSLMRHLTAWFGGENIDPKSGKPHLWHAACRVLFLVTFEIRGVGMDDRPNAVMRRDCTMDSAQKYGTCIYYNKWKSPQ